MLNRTSVQAPGASAVATTYGAANRPLDQAGTEDAYASDADGRLTALPHAVGSPSRHLVWDTLGRLIAVTDETGNDPIATYAYDPLDRLRLVDHGGGDRVRFRYAGLTTSAVQLIDDDTGSVTRHIGTGWGGELLEDWTGSGQDLRVYGRNGHHDLTWTAGSGGTRQPQLDGATLAQKIRWEGGLWAALEYGITPDEIADSELAALWDRMDQAFRAFAPLFEEAMVRLDVAA